MTPIKDNIIDRDVLQAKYVQSIVDSLDMDDCLAMLYDYLNKDQDNLSFNELLDDVSMYYPELLNCSSYSDTNLEATSEGFVGK